MYLDRRAFLRAAGLTLGAGALVACAPAPASAPVAGAGTSAARKGGVLRAAFTGGGAGESLDPYTGGSPIDYVRHQVVYDTLFVATATGVQPALALGADVAPDARSFVLRLRPGVTWHDGSPFTARDVVHTFGYMGAPQRTNPTQLGYYLDVPKVRVRDDLTLEVPTTQPLGDPALFLGAFPAHIVKDGATDFSAAGAVGTGPYRVTAFEPGREARLTRFDGYWGGPAPADELVIVSLADPQAKVNAAAAGQVDFAGDIPFTTARTGSPGPDLEIRTAGPDERTAFGFVLNPTKAPFSDPRARQAVRLGIDRQVFVDTILLGYGAPGNDLLCAGARYFAASPAPARDVDAARKLLTAAGAAGATVTIRSAEYESGYNASTQLLVEQLKDIGLTVVPQIVGTAEFFDPAAVRAADGVAFSSGPIPLAVMYGRLAGFPGLALGDPQLDAAFATAVSTTDEAARAAAWTTVQQVMAERGNSVIWGQADVLSLARRAVTGIEVRTEPKYPYLGNGGLA